ncbi:MAG: type III secretion system cytoplasmic ring protein SctQ [Deltaproteobacteria bacterium]|nr:type III secretion system cytoplasmic ring protein SctQ [Deltaproteobacteria bacterium]
MQNISGVRPYPWHALPRISRKEFEMLKGAIALFSIEHLENALRSLCFPLPAPKLTGIRLDWTAAGPIHPSDSPSLCAVALERAQVPLALECEPLLVFQAVQHIVFGREIEAALGALSWLEQGVFAFWLAPMAQHIGCQVVDVIESEKELVEWLKDPPWVVWTFTLQTTQQSSWMRLWMGDPKSAQPIPPLPPHLPESWKHIGVSLVALVGHCQLPQREIEELEEGDILLPESLFAPLQPSQGNWSEVELRTPGGTYSMHLERVESGWMLRAAYPNKRQKGILFSLADKSSSQPIDTMDQKEPQSDAQQNPTALDAPPSLSDLPIEITIEIGRFELRLEELVQMIPGRLINLGVPLGREVELRAGSRPIAKGELVEIEGELGIRITRVFR